MPNVTYFIVDSDATLLGGVKFDDNNFCYVTGRGLDKLLLGQRKDAIELLCDEFGWRLITPNEFDKLPK